MLTSQQICQQAVSIARVTQGMMPQAGQFLNAVLDDLPREYDLAICKLSGSITMQPGGPNNGRGPYALPTNYLRMAADNVMYYIYGVPNQMVHVPAEQYDLLIMQAVSPTYPNVYFTDQSTSPVSFWVYPQPLIIIPINFRYYALQPEITTPETSATIPWFPHQTYLKTRIAGELMSISGDPRADGYLGDGPSGAVGILRRWLNLQEDREDIAKRIELDPRFFGRGGRGFPASKLDWGIAPYGGIR